MAGWAHVDPLPSRKELSDGPSGLLGGSAYLRFPACFLRDRFLFRLNLVPLTKFFSVELAFAVFLVSSAWMTRYRSESLAKLQRELADKITCHAPLDEIRILLACGADVNEPVVQGLRPLHYAVYSNHIDCVRLLLTRGSNIDAVDDVGYSAIHLCAEHGNYDLMQILIQHKARICFVDPSDTALFPRAYKTEEPLRLALKNCHEDCARLLLENGAEPNARYFLGSEISLISPSDTRLLDLLLMFGADPNVYDRDGLTPLMKACRHRDGLNSVELLVEYGAYVSACALARQDMRTPLHYAILSGNEKIVAYLLKEKARVNMRSDYDKPSPLDLAVLRDQPILVQMLLEAGGNPNAVYTYIGSPLHLASCSELQNQAAIIKLLLDAGADPNLCPRFEDGSVLKSPMVEYFRTRQNPDPSILKLLLAYGAEVVMKSPTVDPRGMLRNLIRVESCSEVFDLLLSAGQDYNVAAIERLNNLPTRRRLQLLELATKPLSLQHLCRLNIRNTVAPMNPEKVDSLPLPPRMKDYLMNAV